MTWSSVLAALATKYGSTVTTSGVAEDPSLEFVTHDEVHVRIDLWRLGAIEHTHLELTPRQPLPRFHINTRFLANLPPDEQALERAYASRSDDAALLRRMWTQPFAVELVRHGDCRLSSKGTALVVDQEGADQTLVEQLLELSLQVVRFDLYATRVLAELPEATLVSEGGFMQAEVPGPSRIVIGPVTSDGVTRTRGMLAAAITPIPEDIGHRIDQLGAAVEVGPDATVIVWPTIEDQRDRLLGGIMILRQLGSMSFGAFR